MSGQDDIAEMKQFVDDLGLNDFEHVADNGGSIWHAFQITAQPSFIFLNDDGTIRRQIGAQDLTQLEAEIELLRSS